MKRKERIIFDNFETDIDREDAIENLLANGIEDPSEDEIWDEIKFLEEDNWNLEKDRMEEIFNNGDFLAIGTCGRWNGNFPGGFIFSNYNELMQRFTDCDYFKIWDENGHFYVTAAHHDGRHSIEIKQLTERGKARYDRWDLEWGKETEREIHEKLFHDSHYTKLINFAHRFYGCPKREMEM